MGRDNKRKVNPHYKFTNKTIPLISIAGLSLGVMSFAALILEIVFTFQKGGVAPLSYGITTILCLIFSVAGLVFSIKGRMMPDVYIYFPTLGMIVNSVNIFGIIYIIGRGILSM
ncbi:MAG: DUF6142 family protein [Lachnospiraceae bacterium]|nr:DUF6142 family protein [Lachnospiraceae bacterium]